ncbi:MAG TPA: phosphoadenosine phosphosulfate reductase family protein [Ktedonobacteraceae bacterium]|nr:phosphoadenosine phosphosulfate reductase family protein [Ktedonobacteraceae bacterium]
MGKKDTLWKELETKKTLAEAISETIGAFYAIDAWQYDTWDIAYSGGKDSTALVTLLAYLFDLQLLPRPKKIVVQYGDTGMEVPPLQQSALALLKRLEAFGFETQVVRPELDNRWFVYMLGRGVPLPGNSFRYCTRNLKGDSMERAMIRVQGRRILVITGVRDGESAARDGSITAACSKDSGECGQGYMHVRSQKSGKGTLAPILGWRVCHVFDWLSLFAPLPDFAIDLLKGFVPRPPMELRNGGFETTAIAEIYGDMDTEDGQTEGLAARTGCMQCPLVTDPKSEHPKQDKMIQRVIQLPMYRYLKSLERLLDVYAGLNRNDRRLRRIVTRKDGTTAYPKGPLTMAARLWGLEQVKAIQDEVNTEARACGACEISLMSPEEETRILELIEANTWPKGWDGTEPLASDFQIPEEEPDAIQLELLSVSEGK